MKAYNEGMEDPKDQIQEELKKGNTTVEQTKGVAKAES